METVELTSGEINLILNYIRWADLCENGCFLPWMIKSDKDCDECPLTKSKNTLLSKMETYE